VWRFFDFISGGPMIAVGPKILDNIVGFVIERKNSLSQRLEQGCRRD
jgi:hypothetical protein